MAISRISKGIFLLVLFIATVGIARADSVFTIESDPVGTTTTFSNTVNGLTATFSTTSDPGGFEIYPNLGFVTIPGNFLGLGPTAPNGLPLDIGFSSNVDSISFNFGLDDDTGILTLTAYEGLTPVGTVTVAGTIPPGMSVGEGSLTFSGATFNSVILSASTDGFNDFGVGNIDVGTMAVPEPGTLGLLAAGLVGLIARSRKLDLPRSSV
jgi:hypothetical protein